MTKFDYLIFIGRFQPLHFGHLHIIEEAFKKSHNLLLLLGSAQESRTPKNPWTVEERISMFQNALPHLTKHIEFEAIIDNPDDEIWCAQVREKIGHRLQTKIGLIGHSKDASSYYLKMFPDIPYFEVANYENISATPIREQYFKNQPIQHLPPAVERFLQEFKQTDAFHVLQR